MARFDPDGDQRHGAGLDPSRQRVKAVVHDRYGPPGVLRLEDVERPVARDGQVVVRVRATTVTRSDAAWRSAKPFPSRFFTGLRRPRRRVLGTEFAGEIAEVGDGVTEFDNGDRVFGASLFGAHAEFVRVKASGAIAHMPSGMPFEEAAAVSDGAILALNALRPVTVGPGTRVLVYGASGSMGTAGVQLAKHFGAGVTAVCDTRHVDLVRSLGADEVIDYTQQDFRANGVEYDVIFDAVGKLRFNECKRSLAPGGAYLPTDGWTNFAMALWTRRFGDRKVRISIPPRYEKDHVVLLKRLLEAGEYRAVIDRTYPLEQVVEATRYVETGQKTGNVVLTVE
jgi:NADPH:quinone reductase-like Zn-dependent oxidoreductase